MGENRINEIAPSPRSGEGWGGVRTRFAPSPTGMVHIGSMRTALYAWLTARHAHGQFILRIEDTDRERLVEGAMEEIFWAFKWIGIDYDEGPEKGGPAGEYIQSKRKGLHLKRAEELLASGAAYKCFCSAERLDKLREDQALRKLPTKYDRHCHDLSAEEIKQQEATGTPYVIRMKIPNDGFTEYKDLIRGRIRVYHKELDDQVLVKSDGFPTYHLANVVDDHEMGITHVIRSEEWLPSTPKHILLYNAFGWDTPVFAHVPFIANASGKKLSKRDGDTAFRQYVEKGYLKEALLNYLVLQGWNPKTTQEVFTLNELIQIFDITKVHKAAPIFNIDKLDWFNQYYIRKLTPDEMLKGCRPYLERKFDLSSVSAEKLKAIVTIEQARIKKFSDITEIVDFFFGLPQLDPKMLIWKKATSAETKNALERGIEGISSIADNAFTKENIENSLHQLAIAQKIPNGTIFWAMRVALTGKERSPGFFDVAAIIGKQETLKRLTRALETLAGL